MGRGRGVSGYNTETLIVIHFGYVFGECQSPCTINTSSVYFGKKSKRIVAANKYKVFRPYPTLHTYSVVVEYRCSIPSFIFFVPTQLSILIQWSSNIATPSLHSSLSSLPNSLCLFSGRRISLPHPFPHLFRPYPTLHTYSVVVEYRCSIPSLIFFAPTQLSILIQWSSNIVTPSLPSSFSSLPNSPYLISGRRISLPHPFPYLFGTYPTLHT